MNIQGKTSNKLGELKMTINQLRSKLYKAAKFLGDVQAVEQAVKTGDPTKITKRVARRAAGKQTGRALGKLFK